MNTPFKREQPRYTLEDIGAEFIDQLSSDVYPSAGSILRELVKNSYDAYLDLLEECPTALQDANVEREVLIRCNRDDKGVGRIFVSDYGIGLSFAELKTFLQIAKSPKSAKRLALAEKEKGKRRKQNTSMPRMGFRGLGTWAMIGGGSQIVITTKRFGTTEQSQLTIHTKEIYSRIGPAFTLDAILNDPKCVVFERRTEDSLPHGTTIEVVCDGPAIKISQYEFNKLYEYTERDEDDEASALLTLLVNHCPIPYRNDDDDRHKKIRGIYAKAGYLPTAILLNGVKLERCLPKELKLLREWSLTVNDKEAAIAWTVEHPDQSKTIKIDDETLIGGPSIQICKLNVPIGAKGLFRPQVMKDFSLRRYVGEIQITGPILPDASGDDLRSGLASRQFKERAAEFYKELEAAAGAKSEVTGARNTFARFKAGLAASENKNMSDREELDFNNAVREAVDKVEAFSKLQNPDTALIAERNEVRRLLDEGGWYKKYSKNSTPKTIKGGNTRRKPAQSKPQPRQLDEKDFLQLLSVAAPKLRVLGLDQDTIDEVFRILAETLFE